MRLTTENEYQLEEQFNEYLDDIYGTVTVGWLEVDAARAIKELDPIAYREEFLDWVDSLEDDDDSPQAN